MINNKILSQKEFTFREKCIIRELNTIWKARIEKIKKKKQKCDITNATIDKICEDKE